jgi:hypothetical protein
MRRRTRLLMLLDAAEQAGIAPLLSARLHAFAYLADVLSPVWGLIPFDGKIYKIEGGPHYPELQLELDQLVALGLVDVEGLEYRDRGKDGARIQGKYSLNFSCPNLHPLLTAMGTNGRVGALDPSDVRVHDFLVELAGALATLSDDQVDAAAGVDVTYRREAAFNVIDFAEWAEDRWQANPTWRAAERFESFMPTQARLSGEKIYLYATYLGRAINAA